MRSKIAILLFTLALPLGSMAQSNLHLEFESAAPHSVFVGEGERPTSSPEDFAKTDADVKVDPALLRPNIWVWNRTTGNVAKKKISEVGPRWVIKDSDYTLVGAVTVRVESKGQPVASAEVSLTGSDPGSNIQSFISPGDKGEIHTFGVRPGPVTLTVKYKVAGKEADPIKESFNLSLRRDKADPVLTVSIPDAVDVVAAPPSPSPSGTAATSPAPAAASPAAVAKEGGSVIGRIVTVLFVLALVGGGCYYIMVTLRKHGDLVQDKLQQLGVDIPKATPNPLDAIAPVAPLTPAAPQRIILGDAPADPVAMPDPMAMASGTPSLRMPNGDAFELPEGETVVGRDLGLGLSLVNESTVSRRHASLLKSGADVRVKDLGSSNGTFVNGVKVIGEAPLRQGDTVQFGAVQCKFEG